MNLDTARVKVFHFQNFVHFVHGHSQGLQHPHLGVDTDGEREERRTMKAGSEGGNEGSKSRV